MSKNGNGNMYKGIKTANPLGGECSHKCSYCCVDRFKKRFKSHREKYTGKPTLNANGYKNISGKDKTIFVCSMTDLFADNVPNGFICDIIAKCLTKPENTYFFQTKNPEKLLWWIEHSVMPNMIACTTIESDIFYPDIMGKTPEPLERAIAMQEISKFIDTQVTIEPILKFNLINLVELIKCSNPLQVNIGIDTGNNNLPEPSKIEIQALINELSLFTKVVLKDNLIKRFGGFEV